MKLSVNKHDCHEYWYMANPVYELGIPAEFTEKGDIKIQIAAREIRILNIHDTELSLFYRKEILAYGIEVWYPILFNGRLV